MKSTIIRLLAALVAGIVAAVTAGTASAESPNAQLLRAYQPVTVFDPFESFRPASVQSFIADAVLERLDGTSWTLVDPDPEPGELPGPGTGVWRLNQDPCSPAAALGGLACYAAAADSGGGGSAVYGRVVRLGDAVVLQYWFFYYDDVYSYLHPPADVIWQAHEGDWEVVNVILSAAEEPLEVAYSQHCLGQRRLWAAAPRWNVTHPIVYVAAGSHANYPSPGLHPLDVRCIPPAAVALLTSHGLPLPVDFTGNGAIAGPPQAGGDVTTIRHLGDGDHGWLSFPGFWGELQYFHSPFTGTVPLGTAPVGPAYHAVWVDPLGTIAAWPSG